MSNTQYIFIRRVTVPDRASLEASINSLGYDLLLDPEFSLYEDTGFLPCQLDGVSGFGFQVFHESVEEILEAIPDLAPHVKDSDYCLSFVWGGSMRDAVCAMMVSCAFAKDFDAVVSYEGEEPSSVQDLLDATADMLRFARKS
jgi:hypothetical protein